MSTQLKDVQIGSKKIKVNTLIADRLVAANDEFKKATGTDLQIGSAYRSPEQQAQIRKKFGYTSDTQASGSAGLPMAAPPNKSYHQSGDAIDVVNWKEAEPYLRKFQLKNELSGDKGHFSVGETSKMQYSNMADQVIAARKKGKSDTEILAKLTQVLPDFQGPVEKARQQGKNDSEIINRMALVYSGVGRLPIASNPDKNQQRAQIVEQRQPGMTFLPNQGIVAKPQKVKPEEKKETLLGTLMSRGKQFVGDIKNIAGQTKEAIGMGKPLVAAERAVIGGGLSVTGALGGAVGDIAAPIISKGLEWLGKGAKEAIKSSVFGQAYQSLPEHIKEPINKQAANLSDKAKEGVGILIEKGSGAYNEWASKNPELAQDARNVVNTLNLLGIEEVAKAGVSGLKIAGKKAVGAVPEKMAQKSATKYAENLGGIFENSTISINRMKKAAESRGINIGEEISKSKITPVIENDRLKFDVKETAKIDQAIADKSRIVDEVVAQYPNTKLTTTEIKAMVKNSVFSDAQILREGRAQEIYSRISKKIDDFGEQLNTKSFTLPQIQDMKKGMWELSKKFGVFDIGKSDSFSKFGDVLKGIIESEVPDVAIKNLNAEIGKNIELRKFLSYIDKRGGIVMKGGKMGKFFEKITGTGVGAGIGAALGAPVGGFGAEIGAALGSLAGGKASEMIRELKQNAQVIGLFDRFLMKGLKEAPESEALIEAKAFIDKVKSGIRPSASPRMQNIIKEQMNNLYQEIKMLPAPKAGAPKVSIETPIELPKKSVSTLESEDIARAGREKVAKQAREVGEKKGILSLPIGKTPEIKPSVIELPGKTLPESKLLTQEEAYKYYQELGSRFGKDYQMIPKPSDLMSIEKIDAFIEKNGDKIPENLLMKLYETQDDIAQLEEKSMFSGMEKVEDEVFNMEDIPEQYDNFKKLLKGVKAEVIEINDYQGLTKFLKVKGIDPKKLDNALWSQDMTGDELLDIFKNKLLQERSKSSSIIKTDIKPSGLKKKIKDVVNKAVEFHKNIPNKEGGFIKIPAGKPSGLKNEVSGLIEKAKEYKSGKDFYELSGGKIAQQLRDMGLRGQEQVSKWWTENVGQSSKKNTQSYWMGHRPSESGPGYNISKDGSIGQDVYTHPEYYFNMKDKSYQESFSALKKIKDNPEAEITIYRAGPKNEFNKGDWISLSPTYAKGESQLEKTKVWSKKVKAKDIQFAGDDLNEFGYFPK